MTTPAEMRKNVLKALELLVSLLLDQIQAQSAVGEEVEGIAPSLLNLVRPLKQVPGYLFIMLYMPSSSSLY